MTTDNRPTLADIKAEMNEELRACFDASARAIRDAGSVTEEIGSLAAYSLIWRSQIALYFDFAFYEQATLMGMTPDLAGEYFLFKTNSLTTDVSVAMDRYKPFYTARSNMIRAFTDNMERLFKICKNTPSYWYDNLVFQVMMDLDKTIEQYLRISTAFYHSKEKFDFLKNSGNRPKLKDFDVKVMKTEEGGEVTLVASPKFQRPEEDDIVKVSSSKAILPKGDTQDENGEEEEEEDWS